MWAPKWTARSAWAIDYSRDINAFIALKGNNLAAASLYTESNYDMTYQELLDMLAAERKAEIETAARHGIPLSALVATPAGAAPQQWLQQEESEEKSEGTKTE